MTNDHIPEHSAWQSTGESAGFSSLSIPIKEENPAKVTTNKDFMYFIVRPSAKEGRLKMREEAGKKSPNFSKYIIYGPPLSFAQSFLSLRQLKSDCEVLLLRVHLYWWGHFYFILLFHLPPPPPLDSNLTPLSLPFRRIPPWSRFTHCVLIIFGTHQYSAFGWSAVHVRRSVHSPALSHSGWLLLSKSTETVSSHWG